VKIWVLCKGLKRVSEHLFGKRVYTVFQRDNSVFGAGTHLWGESKTYGPFLYPFLVNTIIGGKKGFLDKSRNTTNGPL